MPERFLRSLFTGLVTTPTDLEPATISGSPARRRPVWIALFCLLTINAAAQGYLLIMLPPLGRMLGFSDIHAAAILGLSALLGIVSAPVWGSIAERWGRRAVLLAATAAAALGPLSFGAAVSLGLEGHLSGRALLLLLLCIRAAHAVLGAGLLPGAQALIADLTDARDRALGMGVIGAAYGLGGILGGLLMWCFSPAQSAAVFVGFGVAACGSLVGILLFVAPRASIPRAAAQPLPLSRLLPLMIFTFLVISAYGILKQVAALRLHDAMGYPLELASARAGAAMTATAAALIAVQLFLLRHLRRPAEAIMALGAWSGVLGMALCAFAPGFAGLLAGAVLFGIAMGLMLPGTLASLSFRAGCDQQGKAAGLNVMGQGLGLTLGPLLGAAMHRISPDLPLIVAFGLMLVAAGLARNVRKGRLRL